MFGIRRWPEKKKNVFGEKKIGKRQAWSGSGSQSTLSRRRKGDPGLIAGQKGKDPPVGNLDLNKKRGPKPGGRLPKEGNPFLGNKEKTGIQDASKRSSQHH